MSRSGTLANLLLPVGFCLCLSYIVWFFPRFIVSAGAANDNLNSSYDAAGLVDWAILAALALLLIFGVRNAAVTAGEGELRAKFDKLSLFLGRCTMLLVVALVSVMFFEVVARYVFERPTLWANELSLWMAGFIFLLSGLYAMQQRSHIRIFLLYDILPRPIQRTCDVISVSLIWVFTICMIWGSYTEAAQKLLRWETFGTAFDPPIPATLKPMLLFIILLVAVQATVNLIVDWSRGPESHGVVDEDEVADMIETARAQQADGARPS